MKQTKITAFKTASITLLVLASLIQLLIFISNLIHLGTIGNLSLKNTVDFFLACAFDFVPYVLILIGFIAFYKKGKSTAIFGVAFLLWVLGGTFVLLKSLINELGYCTNTFANAIEHILDGRRYWFRDLLYAIELVVIWYIAPAATLAVNLIATVNGFCKARLAKLTIAALVLDLLFDVGIDIFTALRAFISGGFEHLFKYYFDYMLYYTYADFLSFVRALLFTSAIVVFLVYRIKSKKDVDAPPITTVTEQKT